MSEHICNHDCHHDTVSCLGSQLARAKEELETVMNSERKEQARLINERDALKEDLEKMQIQYSDTFRELDGVVKDRDALRVSCDELAKALKRAIEWIDMDMRDYLDMSPLREALAKHRKRVKREGKHD